MLIWHRPAERVAAQTVSGHGEEPECQSTLSCVASDLMPEEHWPPFVPVLVVGQIKVVPEPLPRPAKAGSDGFGRQVEERADLAGGEPLPDGKLDHVAVERVERVEVVEGGVKIERSAGVGRRRRDSPELLVERCRSLSVAHGPTSVVGQHVAGDHEQPEPVLTSWGKVTATAPKYDKNLTEQVGGFLRRGYPASEVAENRRTCLTVELLDLRGLRLEPAHRNFQSQLIRCSRFNGAGLSASAAFTSATFRARPGSSNV